MSSKLESDVCCRLQVRHLVKATEVTAGLAESNGSLLPGICPVIRCRRSVGVEPAAASHPRPPVDRLL